MIFIHFFLETCVPLMGAILVVYIIRFEGATLKEKYPKLFNLGDIEPILGLVPWLLIIIVNIAVLASFAVFYEYLVEFFST